MSTHAEQAPPRSATVAVIPGDGIGTEVVEPTLRILEEVGRRHDLEFAWQHYDWSCEYYTRTGRMMPEDGLERLAEADQILLGAVGSRRARPRVPVGSADPDPPTSRLSPT